MTDPNKPYYDRPKLHLPLALLACKPAAPPAHKPPRQALPDLPRLVAAMVD